LTDWIGTLSEALRRLRMLRAPTKLLLLAAVPFSSSAHDLGALWDNPWFAWVFAPDVLIGTVVATALYIAGMQQWRDRETASEKWRHGGFFAGLAAVFFCTPVADRSRRRAFVLRSPDPAAAGESDSDVHHAVCPAGAARRWDANRTRVLAVGPSVAPSPQLTSRDSYAYWRTCGRLSPTMLGMDLHEHAAGGAEAAKR
jgi:hypothetical protein